MADSAPEDAEAWRRRRREAADEKARVLDRARRAESDEAAQEIARFVAEAGRRGITPEPLRARDYGGRTTYRTSLTGWYLRANRSVGVDVEGRFYVLTVPGGVASRLRGRTPEASPPPRVLGAGGRDGESIDLVDALRKVLDRTTG